MEHFDLIVIGAGPAGISLGAEARAAGVGRIVLLEKAEAHSWTIRKLYPETKAVIANYKGLPAVCTGVLCIADDTKQETLSYLDRAIDEFALDVRYSDGVAWIERRDDGTIEIQTDAGASFAAPVVVLAIGIFGKPNMPDYPIPASLKRAVSYDVTSRVFSDEDVLVVGGGDSAAEYCQYLVQEENRVVLSYRRREFDRLLAVNRDSLMALEERGAVTILRESNIVAVEDFEGAPWVRFAEDEHPDLVFDHVVYALGGQAPRNFLQQVGIEFHGPRPILTDGYATSVPGLYLVGDLVADGRGGGSIITAFNSSVDAWVHIERAIAVDPPG